jgi:hypothetical protein
VNLFKTNMTKAERSKLTRAERKLRSEYFFNKFLKQVNSITLNGGK